jgi:hypothetical protein
MIHLTMTPFISHIRAYVEPDGYARRLPYQAITTVVNMGGTAFLCAAVGDVNRETWVETLKLLKAAGFDTVMLERHGRMKTITL